MTDLSGQKASVAGKIGRLWEKSEITIGDRVKYTTHQKSIRIYAQKV